ncbi:MAG: nucleotidyltransferase [Terracidiphilus sp.]|jgi:hypothetical protein
MPIPESQLDTWSHQGAIAGSTSTYATIKRALESATAPYTGKGYKVFLQGSYGNDTNIYAESDVDVVILLEDCFQSDRTKLTAVEEAAWNTAHPGSVTYSHSQFKTDVLKVLQNAFPNAVTIGDKVFSIKADGNRRKADVLTCIAFRRYDKFNSLYDQSYHEGICFFDKAGNRIANYPKQHSENMIAKHQVTGQNFKPIVRILKNLRSCLIGSAMLDEGDAPSYYLEGLLYNVPKEKFSTSYGDTFVSVINWIQQNADKSKLVTANEQYYLLRDGYKTSWPIADAEKFLKQATKLWNEWQ